MRKGYKKFLLFLNKALYIGSAAMLIAGAILTVAQQPAEAQSSGTIWTTYGDCGTDTQDANHYQVGQQVYINFTGLPADADTHYQIQQTDGAPPKPIVASGTYAIPESGTGCFPAHTIGESEGGHGYSVDYGSKNDNYRVDPYTPIVYGCKDPDANNYDTNPDHVANNTLCTYDPVCKDPDANNYEGDDKYPGDNTLCTYDPVCKDPEALNYVADSKYPADNSLCIYEIIYGCKDPDANNYDSNPDHEADNTMCTYDPACKDPDANNYQGDDKFPTDNTLCTYDPVCKDPDANNYDEANADEKFPEDNTLCTYDPVCKDPDANNYDDDERFPADNTLCLYDPVCKDPDANNYEADPKYSANNELCTYDPVCKDPEAINYVQDEKYPADNTLCVYNVYGCKDPDAINYNPDPDVLENNTLCRYTPPPPPDPLTLSVNYFCNADGLVVWNVINPNDVTLNMTSFDVDGVPFDGFPVTPGSHYLTTVTLGTHTVVLHFNEMATTTLTWRKDVCPLPIPVTGGEQPFAGGGGVLIPVTGADETGKLGMGLSFGGMSMVGLALLLSTLRKMYHL